MKSELLVIGGGIVGLATAWRWGQRFPGRSVRLLEKEPGLAAHQTGRNSGVIHSGIYYKPGSQKAALCLTGKLQLFQALFAKSGANNVPWTRAHVYEPRG